ncbi:tryptophan synthase beta subunit-like PLP-dependent enzyme [Colletotrichum acutatum]|uniref:Tryptophan synthase beta subunit-like PLP-dependent enzyme n=1 Tax=Glomerella acutata TaxID=27357 RepID=A0AAD8UGP0_GLOAC|nr:tryptophan synthase beta subunit-like PLP-dependent enzyme [Colletotrichum acutatum]KAK1718834.1 tryptophan synthase beta subunit-like PLP-dependent enzyme [Colletotrichum acutatum]
MGLFVAELDYLNPSGSKRDHIAFGIIEEAERLGTLKPGQPIVELTSVRTGTGLSLVRAIKGYRFIAVICEGNSVERARMMAATGAEVVLVDQMPSSVPGQISGPNPQLIEIEPEAFLADQFTHDGNWLAHYDGTGTELWEQTDGNLDGFVDYVGSGGGTCAGVTKRLKALNSPGKCFIVEPHGAARPIQGAGYVMPDLIYLYNVPVDGCIQVTGDQAREGAKLLARKEGIFGGFSSGANLSAAIKLPKGPVQEKTFAINDCDSGLKCLSTDLWAEISKK